MRRVIKGCLFALLVLVIPFLDRHFRVETENYKIYFFQGDSTRKPFKQGCYVFKAKTAGWDLHTRLIDDWLSDPAHNTNHGPINPASQIDISDIASLKARLTVLDQEPFDGYALCVFGVYFGDGLDWRMRLLPDLDHLYDFEYPEEFSAECAGLNYSYRPGLKLKSDNAVASIRPIEPSDAGLSNSGGYGKTIISIDMVKEYWSKQNMTFSEFKDHRTGREVIAHKGVGNGHTFYRFVIGENYPNGLFALQIGFESENHELPDDWPLQFRMKKLFF